MTRESSTTKGRERDPPAKSTGSKKIPDPRDCGPTVDTWPILDSEGRPIPDEEGKRDRRSDH